MHAETRQLQAKSDLTKKTDLQSPNLLQIIGWQARVLPEAGQQGTASAMKNEMG